MVKKIKRKRKKKNQNLKKNKIDKTDKLKIKQI